MKRNPFDNKTQTEITNNLTQSIIDVIRKAGGYAKRINVTSVRGRKATNAGHPDIDAMFKGVPFKVEIKKDSKDKLNLKQIEFKKEYESAGGIIIVVYRLDLFLLEFETINKIANILKIQMETFFKN